jgi:hypothetical protein
MDTGRVYAMKTLQKVEMLKRDQVRVCCVGFAIMRAYRV